MDQTILYQRIKELIEPVIISMGLRFWGLEVPSSPRGGVLRVYIDSEDGVTIDECARVSRHLNYILDMEDPLPGPYTLEVSSPGLDRPFFELDQLKPYVDKPIQLVLKEPYQGSRKWSGTLMGVRDKKVFLRTQKQEISFDWDQIQKIRLVA